LTTPVDTSVIAAEAAMPSSVVEPAITEQLKQKFDQVDLLIADLGQIGDFKHKAAEFAVAATIEARWNRWSRAATLIVVMLIVIGLAFTLYQLLVGDAFSNLRSVPVAFSTALAAVVGGGVILVSGVSKAVFSSFAERNAGVPVPDHLKSVMDGLNSIFKSN
jgi:hypothetical protein